MYGVARAVEEEEGKKAIKHIKFIDLSLHMCVILSLISGEKEWKKIV